MILIVIILLLIGVIVYCINNTVYEKFTSDTLNLEEIIENPRKTREFIDSQDSKVFKKNSDLDYLKKQKGDLILKNIRKAAAKLTPEQIKQIKDVFTNQLAPIISQATKQIKIPTTSDNTNRIPDKISTVDKYVLPELNLNKIQDRTFKSKKDHFVNYITRENTNISDNGYLPGYSDNTIPTFSRLNSTVSVNGIKYIINQATAVGKINKGKLSNILVVSNGEGYKSRPRVDIISKCNGENAKCIANIKHGRISGIEIISPGNGYEVTPHIIIDKPNINTR